MGYLLSKLLPLLVLPLGLSLICLVLALLFRWRWPLMAAIGLLWVFGTGVVSQALWRGVEGTQIRRSAASAPRADAIVVLSGGRHAAPGDARIIEWHDPDRFLAGVDLFMAGRAPVCCSPAARACFVLDFHRGTSVSKRSRGLGYSGFRDGIHWSCGEPLKKRLPFERCCLDQGTGCCW